MVSKNWKLFVVCLSHLWLDEMLLGHPEKENVSCRNKKKWRERMGQTPYH
jgi:hypothetical protein